MELGVVVAGLGVGFVVGLTGMGGGALMTPVLVLFFGISPLAAVSSDLVAAAVMKPVGSWVHMRRGTIQWPIVRWLVLGSVPSAFAGVLLIRALAGADQVEHVVRTALGVALLVAAAGLVYKAYRTMLARVAREASAARGVPMPRESEEDPVVAVRPLPTLLVGVVGGLVVGMTSVGSGSLVIIALLALYPKLTANRLVGTDLVQAVPMVASAAIGHILFGDFQLGLTGAILLGSVPGVYLGAMVSSRAPGWLVRRALAVVLTASGLKTLGLSTPLLGVVVAASILVGPLAWIAVRRRAGLRAQQRVTAAERETEPV